MVTIGFRVEGPVDEEIEGIDSAIFGYDKSVVNFVEGASVDEIYHDFADPAIGAFDGIPNVLAGAMEERLVLGDDLVWFLSASDAPSLHSYNPLDPGLDGFVGGGDAQFRVTFLVTAPGVTTVSIGTRPPLFVVVLSPDMTTEADNAYVVISSDAPPYVVPEPGTALLLGLGLAALACCKPLPVPAPTSSLSIPIGAGHWRGCQR